ncbi:MAG: hypothetical protein GVY24_04725, partial [Planctomycetes bacterium]|nr:hypothetical protein [Planctomycetota bacterium]
ALRTLRAAVGDLHARLARRELEQAPADPASGDDADRRLARLRELAPASRSAGRVPRITG